MIRKAHLSDDLNIVNIYNYYILNSMSTFEEQPVSQREMRFRIEQVQASLPWLVYETNGEILGYAYATQWKPRSAYRNTVESTVYVRSNSYGKGVGKQLFPYKRYSVICDDSKSLIGGYTGDKCAIPNSNFANGPVPDELACDSADYTSNSKGIKVLVAYYDRDGSCKTTSLENFKIGS